MMNQHNHSYLVVLPSIGESGYKEELQTKLREVVSKQSH